MREGPVIFDVDGVLADFHTGYAKVAQSLGLAPPEEGNWDAWLNPLVWESITHSRNFWSDLVPLVGSQTRRRLWELEPSRDVYFVTSRVGASARTQTIWWLSEHAFAQFPTVVMTTRKGEFAKVVGAAYLIDDKAGNAVYTQYESPQTVAVLLDKSWNQFNQRNLGSKVVRVKTVDEFLDLVDRGH